MNELSTEVHYAVILWHDKSEKFITEAEYQNLLLALSNPSTKSIKLGGVLSYVGGINKVMTLEEYYKEYPDKIPTYGQPFQSQDYFNAPQTVPKDMVPSLIRGLKRSIAEMRAEGHEPTKALALLEKYEKTNEVVQS